MVDHKVTVQSCPNKLVLHQASSAGDYLKIMTLGLSIYFDSLVRGLKKAYPSENIIRAYKSQRFAHTVFSHGRLISEYCMGCEKAFGIMRHSFLSDYIRETTSMTVTANYARRLRKGRQLSLTPG